MRDGTPVSSPAEGTIYMITVAVPGNGWEMPHPEFSAVNFCCDPVYGLFEIDGNHLASRVYDIEGKLRDEFTIDKH